jgi:hypothetical protein
MVYFHSENSNLGILWRALEWKMAIRYIYGHLVYFIGIGIFLNNLVSAPASGIKLIYTKPDSRTINLTCSATGVYPKPEVQLSWGSE